MNVDRKKNYSVSVTGFSVIRRPGEKLACRNRKISVEDFYSANRSQLSHLHFNASECPDESFRLQWQKCYFSSAFRLVPIQSYSN